ncbi:MAG: hypothetical protein CTY15_04080 [Methylocystis sp.]|nr:MAG: hypothetical protein CTY15_04080 [Methylocystis sp.]
MRSCSFESRGSLRPSKIFLHCMPNIIDHEALFVNGLVILAATIGATSQFTSVYIGRSTLLTLAATVVLAGLLIARFRANYVIAPPSQWAVLKSARLDTFARQAETLLANQRIAQPAFFTALLWTTNVSLILILFKTILPDIHFGVLDAITLQVIAALAIALPASPAGLGVFEAGIVAYLTTMHGVQTERAISAALAYHLSITAPHTAIVIAFFASMLPGLLRARLWP